MMSEAIKNFPKQFRFKPKIENGPLKKFKRFVVCGMGGSHLAADIIKSLLPGKEIIVWPDYGLPEIDWKKTLVIVSSYSGNTEEPIDAFEKAAERQLPVTAIAIGNKLLDLAKTRNFPYVQLPDTGIQPRSALGFSLRAMLKVMKENELLKRSGELAKTLKPADLEETGKSLAEKLKNKIPVIYASEKNSSVAYNWKIKFNETGKIPAFYNIFPELNHNEMNGFDVHPVKSREAGTAEQSFNGVKDASRALSQNFHFIFLKDGEDHPRVQKRFEMTAQLYANRGLPVEMVEMTGENRLIKIFSSLLLADWTAMHIAENCGFESEQVPLVEEFKGLMK